MKLIALILFILILQSCKKQCYQCTTYYEPIIIRPEQFYTDTPEIYDNKVDTLILNGQEVISHTICIK